MASPASVKAWDDETDVLVCGYGLADTVRRYNASCAKGVDEEFGRSRETLYELGSMFSNLYQNGSYLTEAMISGRAAGRNAVSRAPA